MATSPMKKLAIGLAAALTATMAFSATPSILSKTKATQKAAYCSVFLYRVSMDMAQQRQPGNDDPQDPAAQAVAVSMLLAQSLTTKAEPTSEARMREFINKARALPATEQEHLAEYCADLAERTYVALTPDQKEVVEEAARNTLINGPAPVQR